MNILDSNGRQPPQKPMTVKQATDIILKKLQQHGLNLRANNSLILSNASIIEINGIVECLLQLRAVDIQQMNNIIAALEHRIMGLEGCGDKEGLS